MSSHLKARICASSQPRLISVSDICAPRTMAPMTMLTESAPEHSP